MSGWNLVRQYLHISNYPKEDTGASIKIFHNCKNLIMEFKSAIYHKSRVENLDTTKMDHALDAMRYGLMHLGKPRINKEVDWFQKAIEDLQNDGNGSTAVGHS